MSSSSPQAARPGTAARERDPARRADASSAGRPIVDGPIAPGAVLLERYEILSVIGGGGMGTVYLAEQLEIGRTVAIKILSEEWSTNRFAVRRFRAEARTAGAIGHPNIVQVHDAGAFSDGRLYLVMEYVDGRDLKHELVARRTLEPLRACTIMQQVGLALGAVHALGVIHRDLKPGNIMLVPQPDGELVKVLDFGIAANTSATGLHGERLTRPGWIMGTPEYMAPEQATGDMPSPALDIYAMGAILHELLTGALPMTAEHSFELLAFKRHNRAPSLRERAPELPASLIALVDDCLEIDPAKRPPDVASVVARLKAVIAELRGEVIPTSPTPAPARARWAASGLFGLGIVGVLAALLAGGSFAPSERVGPSEHAQPVEQGVPAPSVPSLPSAELDSVPVPEVSIPAQPEPAAASERPAVVDRSVAVGPRSKPRAPKDAEAVAPNADVAGPPPPKQVVGEEPAAAPAGGPESARCERVRKAAEEARGAHQWAALRKHSRSDECWDDPTVPRKLQTKAMLELGDYSGCVSVGSNLADPDVVEWVRLCRIRGGS